MIKYNNNASLGYLTAAIAVAMNTDQISITYLRINGRVLEFLLESCHIVFLVHKPTHRETDEVTAISLIRENRDPSLPHTSQFPVLTSNLYLAKILSQLVHKTGPHRRRTAPNNVEGKGKIDFYR